MRITTTTLLMLGAVGLAGCDQITSYLPSFGGSRVVEQRCTAGNCTASCGAREIITAAVCAAPPGAGTTFATVRRNALNQPDAPWTATCFAPNQTLILTCTRQ